MSDAWTDLCRTVYDREGPGTFDRLMAEERDPEACLTPGRSGCGHCFACEALAEEMVDAEREGC